MTTMLGDTNTQSRIVGLLIIAVLLCSSLAVGVGAAGSSNLFVTVSDATISDDEPVTGESVMITPTIRHSSAGDGAFEVNDVTLSTSNGEEVAHASNLGTLGNDESIKVPLQTAFDTAGEKHLTITVRGVKTDSSGAIDTIGTVNYPVFVDVSAPTTSAPEPDPQVEIDTKTLVAGSPSVVNVTVSNGASSDLSGASLQLSAAAPDKTLDTTQKVQPVIKSGNLTEFSFDVQPNVAGSLTLEAEFRSEDKTVNALKTVSVKELHEQVSVDAAIITRDDSRYLQYRVTNLGNVRINDLTVVGQAGETELPAAGIGAVDVASSRTVSLPTDVQSGESLEVQGTYTVGGESNEYSRTIDPVSVVSEESLDDSGMLPVQQSLYGGGSPTGIQAVLVLSLVSLLISGFLAYVRFQNNDSN